MGFLGGLLDFGAAAANFGLQAHFGAKNYRLAKEQFGWQQDQANITREREDTAIQRRAADMQAAGLNPLLAAGSPAAASTPITAPTPVRRETPQFKGFSVMDQVQVAQALRLGQEQIGRVRAENLLLEQQARKEGANADIMELERDVARSNWDELNESTLTVRGMQRLTSLDKGRGEIQLIAARTASEYARERNISADTAYQELETAIRNRDFNALKDFGLLDRSGGIAKDYLDIATMYGIKAGDIDGTLTLLSRLFAAGGAFKRLFK